MRTPPGAYDAPLPGNLELADRFQAIADYLALDGATIYRILAYEKAATAFREHPTSIAELALRGELRTLPGVGEAIETKVLEYLSTGGMAYLSELGAKYPEGVLELIRLPGVGPKMARKLWDVAGYRRHRRPGAGVPRGQGARSARSRQEDRGEPA